MIDVFRALYASAGQDALRAYDITNGWFGPGCEPGAKGTGRKANNDSRCDAARTLARLVDPMLPEVREALIAIVVREERIEDVGARLCTYTNAKIRCAVALTFLRLALRHLVEVASAKTA